MIAAFLTPIFIPAPSRPSFLPSFLSSCTLLQIQYKTLVVSSHTSLPSSPHKARRATYSLSRASTAPTSTYCQFNRKKIRQVNFLNEGNRKGYKRYKRELNVSRRILNSFPMSQPNPIQTRSRFYMKGASAMKVQ